MTPADRIVEAMQWLSLLLAWGGLLVVGGFVAWIISVIRRW